MPIDGRKRAKVFFVLGVISLGGLLFGSGIGMFTSQFAVLFFFLAWHHKRKDDKLKGLPEPAILKYGFRFVAGALALLLIVIVAFAFAWIVGGGP